MRKKPIRCVRVPLSKSFEEYMKRTKKEREKLIQEISEKYITASDFSRMCQDNELNTKKNENTKE